MTRRFRLVLSAAAVYGIPLSLIAAWPTHVNENFNVLKTEPARWLIGHGASADTTFRLIESTANVAIFVPFGALLMLASPRITWLQTAIVALAVSGGIEILQAVARPGRTASAADVAANVLGACVGALGVVIWRTSARRRAGSQDVHAS